MHPRAAFRAMLSAVLAGTFLLMQPSAVGQEITETARKIKTQVAPVYPDLAKKMNVRGKVRLEVTVTPDGKVKSIRALGGHPLLASAAQNAVNQWKFETGPRETVQIVECNFE